MPKKIITKQPKQKKPRPTAYSKENPSPHAFEPGQSGNPGGKPREHLAMARALRTQGAGRAQDAACKAVGLPRGSSKIQVGAERILISMQAGKYPEHLQAADTYARLTGDAGAVKVSLGFDDGSDSGSGNSGPQIVINFSTSRYHREYQKEHPNGPWPVTTHETAADGTHYVSSHFDPLQRRVLVAPGKQAPVEVTASDVDMVPSQPEILPPDDCEE